jgi:hypothetical protein
MCSLGLSILGKGCVLKLWWRDLKEAVSVQGNIVMTAFTPETSMSRGESFPVMVISV